LIRKFYENLKIALFIPQALTLIQDKRLFN
jgi:hypothetical protein